MKDKEVKSLLTKVFSIYEDAIYAQASTDKITIEQKKDYIVLCTILNRRPKLVFEIEASVLESWYTQKYSHIVKTSSFTQTRKDGRGKRTDWLDNLMEEICES